MVDVFNPQNYTDIKFLLYTLEIQFCGPWQTVNQITAGNAVVLFSSSFLRRVTHKKYIQLQMQLDLRK